MPAPDLFRGAADDRALLKGAVAEAGRLAVDFFRGTVRHWDKTDRTPVSEADLAVDGFLKARLLEGRPDYGWLSEETVDDTLRLGRDRVWIVDPIDGTRSFLDGKSEWTISVALVERGLPVLAAVANPLEDELYEATRGGGAWLNGRPITVSNRSEIAGCRMLANQGAFAAARWAEAWPDMARTACVSMAYRLCLVAEGRHDATFAISHKHDWDLAAAHLVLHEAGGLLTTHDGREIVYNRPVTRHETTLAAGPALHKALLARTRQLLPRAVTRVEVQ